jgi:hypothetical protein
MVVGRERDARTLRVIVMSPTSPPAPPRAFTDSPLYLLAALVAARRSGDRALERVTRRRLRALGIRIRFGDELTARAPAEREGVTDAL